MIRSPEEVARQAIENWIDVAYFYIEDFLFEEALDDLEHWTDPQFDQLMKDGREAVYNIMVGIRYKAVNDRFDEKRMTLDIEL